MKGNLTVIYLGQNSYILYYKTPKAFIGWLAYVVFGYTKLLFCSVAVDKCKQWLISDMSWRNVERQVSSITQKCASPGKRNLKGKMCSQSFRVPGKQRETVRDLNKHPTVSFVSETMASVYLYLLLTPSCWRTAPPLSSLCHLICWSLHRSPGSSLWFLIKK